jgi:ketosteroid isomerase-like protein
VTSTREEILACEEQLRLADLSPAPDTSAILDKLLADDLLMFSPQGAPFTKTFILEAHRPPKKTPFESIVQSDFEFRDLGETAVVSCRTEYKTGAQSFVLRMFRVWSKKSGRWQVAAGSVSLAAKPTT